MSYAMHTKITIAAIVSLLAILGSVVAVMGSETDAAYTEDYGEIFEIDIAPGFSHSYAPSYPSDLQVTTSIEKYEDTGIDAEIIGGNTLKVTVKDGVTTGSYDLILKASSNTGGFDQVAYQHIRYNVVAGLSVSGSINDIIKGASINFTPNGTSSMGTVTWAVKSGTTLPDGLSLSNNTITGVPTNVGENTVSLTATAKGETKDLVVTFTVYNKIVTGSAETITSYGNAVSSTAIVQTGNDLGVTWKVTNGTMPAGFTLDESTGVVSGSSATLNETSITITGTSANGPAQTATKTITIRSEPEFSISAPESTIVTFPGADNKTLQLTATSGTSDVTWSINSVTGITISDAGLLTVSGNATSANITVTANTAYGQTATESIIVAVEDVATIDGNGSLSAKVNTPATCAFVGSIEGTWSVDASNVPAGATVTISNLGVLTLEGNAPADFTVTIKLTTAGGQEITKEITCKIVSTLIFTDVPTSGLIIYEV
ncbi:putative Ig domain-containing protein [Candidatus Methanoprimaticola sp. MG2]|uniref:putative Ig domain-containing protein n=1 Tax=Candidatus Methanoprimaticola sp. MG2 TaxID=3228838 RepID=UPI0039C729A8